MPYNFYEGAPLGNEGRWTALVGIVAVLATLVGTWATNRNTLDTVRENNQNAIKLATIDFNQKEYDKYRDRRREAYLTLLDVANTFGSAPNTTSKMEGDLLAARDKVRIIGTPPVRDKADKLTSVALHGYGVGDAPYDKARIAFVNAAAAEVEAYSKEKP